MLYGRGTECGVIEKLLRSARSGGSGTLLMRGEAGVGKSALLDFAARAAEGMLVLRARGVEAESHIAYAGLHELLRPVASGVGRLPSAQARALQAALGLVDGTGQDRFLVSAAVLSLLAQAAERTPVVCLLDDIQWLDSESVAAVAFAARRLHTDPVAVVLTVRDGTVATEERVQRLAGATELPVGPLDAEAVDALMNDPERPELDHRLRQRVVDAARGNPLALVELSRENALRVAEVESGSCP